MAGKYAPGQSGNPAGRPKGIPNKIAGTAKEALQEAFRRIGDVEALAKWGKENPDKFYPIWSKILPTEVTGAEGGDLIIQILKLSDKTDLTPVE